MAWGFNGDGRLGIGTCDGNRVAPKALPLAGVTAIAANGAHGLALLSNGAVKPEVTAWTGKATMAA